MTPEELIYGRAIDQVKELRDITNSTLLVLKCRQTIKRNRIHYLNKKKNELTTAFNKSITAINKEIRSTEVSRTAKRLGPDDDRDRPTASS